MKNEVTQNLQKLQTLLHYIGHPIRTEGEIRVRVNKALGPAELSGSSVSVFEDPEASLSDTWEAALDHELAAAKAEYEKLKDPAKKIAAKSFAALGVDAFAKLNQLEEVVITSETLTAPAQKVLGQIQRDVELAESIITAAQQKHTQMVTQVTLRNPSAAASFVQPIELPAEYQPSNTVPLNQQDPSELLKLAMESYLAVPARGSEIDPGQAALGRGGSPLTTREADLSHNPAAGVDAIRALDTYFTLAFPHSPVKSAEERVETLFRYALGLDQNYRKELVSKIQEAQRDGARQVGLNQKAIEAIAKEDVVELANLFGAGLKPSAQTITGVLTRLSPDHFRQVVAAGFDVRSNSALVMHQLGNALETADPSYRQARLEILKDALRAGADPTAMPRDTRNQEFKDTVRKFKNGTLEAAQPTQETALVR